MSFESYTVLLTIVAVFAGFGLIVLFATSCVFCFDRHTAVRTKALLVMMFVAVAIFEYQLIRGAVIANDLNRVYGSGSSFKTVDDLSDFDARLELLRQQEEEQQLREVHHDG